MSKKHEKVCKTGNYILASTVNGSISISVFYPLLGIPIGITRSATGLKICAIAA